MIARIHHYIPRCYLKGFAHERSRRGQLFVVDGHTRRTFTTSTRKVGAQKDFLLLAAGGAAPDALEKAMAKFEGELATSLDNIIASGSFGSENDRAVIFNFIALLAIRNPRWREQVRGFHERTARLIMDMTLATRERWESTERQARAAGALDGTRKVSYEEIKDFFERGEFTIEVPTMRHLQLEIETHDKLLPYLFGRKWHLLKATSGQGVYVTSDHPVCLLWADPERRGNAMYPPGFGLEHTGVLFPLSKELALVGTFEGEEAVTEVSSMAIAAFNGAVVAYAERQVYAPSANFYYLLRSDSTPRAGAELVRDQDFARTREESR